MGADRIMSGEVRRGRPAGSIDKRGRGAGRYRIGYVSENRKDEGLILIHSVLRNIDDHRVAAPPERDSAGSPAGESASGPAIVERLDIKAPSLATVVGSLSGGNQQKVSLAKWLAAGVNVLIIDEPTVGIDVRTKGNLHELIWELASQGLAILLISSDMPEMVRLADRIVVMRGGRIVGELEQPALRRRQPADHGLHPAQHRHSSGNGAVATRAAATTGGVTCPSTRSRTSSLAGRRCRSRGWASAWCRWPASTSPSPMSRRP